MFNNRSAQTRVTTIAVVAALIATLSLQLVLALFGINGNVFAATNHAAVVSVPMAMNFQGVLRDAQGKPLANGTYAMTFRLYSTLAATTALWSEKQTSVAVKDGRFSTTLGSVTPLLSSSFASPNRFVGVQVGTQQEMQPRQRLGTVPFAVNADLLDGKDAEFYARADHKHSGADITSGQVADARVADNLTVNGGKVDNSPIGQTKPQPGGFTLMTANNATLSNRLFAPNVKADNFEVTPPSGLPTKPIIFKWFTGPADNEVADGSTGIPGDTYVCGISGLNTGMADINEFPPDGHEPLKVIAYVSANGSYVALPCPDTYISSRRV